MQKNQIKTTLNSINDIREAVDFCYYYSNEARKLFSSSVDPPL